jgi:hypothetical protein
MTEFKPTARMAANAERGLKLREKHKRGGTEVGVRRAHQLAERRAVSEADVKDIHSYFARHEVDRQGEGWADRSNPSAGYIAWLLWGGDAGKSWADAKRKRID